MLIETRKCEFLRLIFVLFVRILILFSDHLESFVIKPHYQKFGEMGARPAV